VRANKRIFLSKMWGCGGDFRLESSAAESLFSMKPVHSAVARAEREFSSMRKALSIFSGNKPSRYDLRYAASNLFECIGVRPQKLQQFKHIKEVRLNIIPYVTCHNEKGVAS